MIDKVELYEASAMSTVKNALETGGVYPDVIGRNKAGNIMVRKGFFYTHGYTAEKFEASVKSALDKAGIKYEIVDRGEHWVAFRGGASTSQQSHWYVEIKLITADPDGESFPKGEDVKSDDAKTPPPVTEQLSRKDYDQILYTDASRLAHKLDISYASARHIKGLLKKFMNTPVVPKEEEITEMTTYDPDKGDVINALRAIRDAMGKDTDEKPIKHAFLTFQEGTSNKYHYFAMFKSGDEFTAANAYARIGYSPQVDVFAVGDEETVSAAYNQKLSKKKAKGYILQESKINELIPKGFNKAVAPEVKPQVLQPEIQTKIEQLSHLQELLKEETAKMESKIMKDLDLAQLPSDEIATMRKEVQEYLMKEKISVAECETVIAKIFGRTLAPKALDVIGALASELSAKIVARLKEQEEAMRQISYYLKIEPKKVKEQQITESIGSFISGLVSKLKSWLSDFSSVIAKLSAAVDAAPVAEAKKEPKCEDCGKALVTDREVDWMKCTKCIAKNESVTEGAFKNIDVEVQDLIAAGKDNFEIVQIITKKYDVPIKDVEVAIARHKDYDIDESVKNIIQGFVENYGKNYQLKTSKEVLDALSNGMSEDAWGPEDAERFFSDDKWRKAVERQLLAKLKLSEAKIPKPKIGDGVERLDMSKVNGNVVKIIDDNTVEVDWGMGEKTSEKIKSLALATRESVNEKVLSQKEVRAYLDKAIQTMYDEIYAASGVTSGDIEPLEVLRFDDAYDTMAEVIYNQIKNNQPVKKKSVAERLLEKFGLVKKSVTETLLEKFHLNEDGTEAEMKADKQGLEEKLSEDNIPSESTLRSIYKHLVKEENAAVANKKPDEWIEGFGRAVDIVRSYIKGSPYESRVDEKYGDLQVSIGDKTGLIVIDREGMMTDAIEVTREDAERLLKKLQALKDKAAPNKDFESVVNEVAPPGGEYIVKKLKQKKDVNPYKIAWWMRGKGAHFRKGPHSGEKMASVKEKSETIDAMTQKMKAEMLRLTPDADIFIEKKGDIYEMNINDWGMVVDYVLKIVNGEPFLVTATSSEWDNEVEKIDKPFKEWIDYMIKLGESVVNVKSLLEKFGLNEFHGEGHECDNCTTPLGDDDYAGAGNWSYTCPKCGFYYSHGSSKTAAEQVERFLKESNVHEAIINGRRIVEQGDEEELTDDEKEYNPDDPGHERDIPEETPEGEPKIGETPGEVEPIPLNTPIEPQTNQPAGAEATPAEPNLNQMPTEAVESQIRMDYPEEPMTSTALAYADSLIDDPKTYGQLRNLNWDGVYSNSETFLKQAKIVGSYNNFTSEIAKRLTDRFEDSAKYRLAREGSVAVYITIRDPDVKGISLEGLKEFLKASAVDRTANPGEARIWWD